ncbi:SanA/YdcF family protein [Croceivirga radicis]|uniref:SanA/YdcF family protein n=1 Tax=Croceivirga radicis TaxID=1929488 RepID=UPI000255B27A|nr:ElyC/SanA/YdcF family protein [Croceivirga radicis]
MFQNRFIHKLVKALLFSLIVTLVLVFIANFSIEKNADGKTYDSIENVPTNHVGLVLGTSKYLKAGGVNPYFKFRVAAAVRLYKAGKIAYVLVSGDNGSKYYNEPSEFKKELVKEGVPEDRIILDYAGFRTLDSVVRAKEVFGQERITIISQAFHNERAIYLAEKNGLHAIGYNAKDVGVAAGLKTQVREYFARTKVFIDILFGVKPKFIGKQEAIPNPSNSN